MTTDKLMAANPQGKLVRPESARPEEWLAFLWPLLERQALLYTGGDSTSLPLEEVQRLFESMLFCLEVAGEGGPDDTVSPAERLKAGQRALLRETEEGRRLWRRVKAMAPAGSATLQETLAGIGQFFVWYDIRFFAHEIPGMIDYPPCLPVPEGLKGIRYINEYLRRLHHENRLLGCFPAAQAQSLLDAHSRGWRELPLNLCAPVFSSALGLVLVGADPGTLTYSEETRQKLASLLADVDEEMIRRMLEKGAAQLCNRLRLWDTGLRGYFAAYARTLPPFLLAADAEGLANVFPSAGGRTACGRTARGRTARGR